MRKFKCLVNEWDLDDFGYSGITFTTQSLIEGRVYREHQELVDAWDGRGGLREKPSGYIIDGCGCWIKIGRGDFWKKFKEVEYD
jgi:hypothetical protein